MCHTRAHCLRLWNVSAWQCVGCHGDKAMTWYAVEGPAAVIKLPIWLVRVDAKLPALTGVESLKVYSTLKSGVPMVPDTVQNWRADRSSSTVSTRVKGAQMLVLVSFG